MDKEQLSQIVAEVIRQLQPYNKKKKVLVVLDGHSLELSSLEMIKNKFIEYDRTIFLAHSIDKQNHIENYDHVITSNQCNNKEELIQEFDEYIFLASSLKMISKLAHIIIDDNITEIFYEALCANKKVKMLSAEDNKKIKNLPEALKSEARNLISKIQSYGVEIITCTKGQSTIKKGLLSLERVKEITKGKKEIWIDSSSIITPLATEYIKDNKINIYKTKMNQGE